MAGPTEVALVTGASRGIGRAIAVELVRAGFEVHGTGRDEDALAETAAQCGSPGSPGSFHPHQLEVRSAAAVEALVAELPRLDLCVNNAAILRVGSFVDTPIAAVEEMLAVNVLGAFTVMRAAAGRMLQEGGGRIVDIASDTAIDPSPEVAAYAATKHPHAGHTKTLAEEVMDRDIQVTTVYPGAVDTDIHDVHSASRQGFMEAEEVGRAIVAALLATGTTVRVKELHLQPLKKVG